MMMNVLLCIAAAVISWLSIRYVIANAEKLGLVQAPVARSSHRKPTPTGGGIGIFLAASTACLILAGGDSVMTVLCGLGALIAVLGLIDDRMPLPARIRFPVQIGAVSVAVFLSDSATLFGGETYSALWVAAFLLLTLAGTWWVNLFNFMDGIDGIAGQQALTMLVSAMATIWINAETLSPLWWMMAAVAISTLSFLIFNWPPARIFMGDVGSTFLAFMILCFALVSMASGWMALPQWLLLASFFAADATLTLLVRFFRHENVTQAHRSHGYQRLSRLLGGALPVTAAVATFNLVVVLPLSVFLPISPVSAYSVVIAVYAFLTVVCLWAGAGLPDGEAGGHWRRKRG